MASGYSLRNPDGGRSPRARRNAQIEEAELLVPPEAAPAQLSRSMFSQPSSHSPPPAPLTNHHLARVARLDAAAHGRGGGGGGAGAGGGGRGGRPPRSEAATSVRGGRGGFSVVSDEERIEVEGEPDTLADDDLDEPPHAHGLGQSGLAGLGYGPDGRPVYGNGYSGGGAYGHGGGGGGPDPLDELEADTPLVRLYEVQSDLQAESQGAKDAWTMVHLAQLALGHAKVVWRTMPVAVREEPLLLAKAHFALARAYQAHKCDKQAAEHGKDALAAIPAEVADTEAAAALRTEVQVMRAEALLSAAAAPGLAADAAASLARKALNQLVKAAGLRPPVAFTPEEVDDVEAGHSDRSTIDQVADMGIVALMAQSHGVVAESRLRAAETARLEKQSSLRSADDTAARADRRTDRGDAFYSPEQLERWRLQERHFRDEADAHEAEAVRLAGEAERAYESAMYCLNHVIDVEGRRLEDEVGRERKTEHPTFRALWCRSLDFMAGMAEAYGVQGQVAGQLQMVDEVLSAFAQYGGGGWLPVARHVRALKDKGALLVAQRQYDKAVYCYEELEALIHGLYPSAAEGGSPGDVLRREVQGAEVLKLRGDVALAAGDFRNAQHLFSQALEAYQRHLGVHAGVARDLLHRIDEVKAYLVDSRVMGRMASFGGGGGAGGGGARGSGNGGGGGGGSSPPTPKGGSSGSGLAARSPASRSSPLTLPPSGGGGGGGRPGSSASLHSHSHSHNHLGPGRASGGGLYALDEEGTGTLGGSGSGGLGSTISSAGASTIPALSPGHRLPHLNTLAPNGGARPGRASLHDFDD